MKPPSDVTARVCERIVACGRAPLDKQLLPAARQLFGGAQAIARLADGYCAGSDPRKDGQAGGS